MTIAAGHPRDISALTGIRGIAAWAVVLYHLRLSLVSIFPAPVIAVLAKGYLAVDLFFVLSGFVIWLNYADRIGAGGLAATGHFLWRRIARIWPLHVTILAAFAALALVLQMTGRDTSDFPLAQLPLHLLLVQNWGFTAALAWNDPAWSISTEFAAYLLFPLMALAAARLPAAPSAGLLVLGISVCAALWALFTWQGHSTLGADIPRLGLWRCLAGFVLGCVACALWRRGAGTAAGWAGCAIGWAVAGWALGWAEPAIFPFLTFALILALALAGGGIARFLGRGATHWLGEISYSTYLSHVLLFQLFKMAFVGDDLQLGWAGLAGYLLLLLAASAGLYRWVERPAQHELNRLYPRRFAPLAQPHP